METGIAVQNQETGDLVATLRCNDARRSTAQESDVLRDWSPEAGLTVVERAEMDQRRRPASSVSTEVEPESQLNSAAVLQSGPREVALTPAA
ncbi:unnamed protein product [Lota lota]